MSNLTACNDMGCGISNISEVSKAVTFDDPVDRSLASKVGAATRNLRNFGIRDKQKDSSYGTIFPSAVKSEIKSFLPKRLAAKTTMVDSPNQQRPSRPDENKLRKKVGVKIAFEADISSVTTSSPASDASRKLPSIVKEDRCLTEPPMGRLAEPEQIIDNEIRCSSLEPIAASPMSSITVTPTGNGPANKRSPEETVDGPYAAKAACLPSKISTETQLQPTVKKRTVRGHFRNFSFGKWSPSRVNPSQMSSSSSESSMSIPPPDGSKPASAKVAHPKSSRLFKLASPGRNQLFRSRTVDSDIHEDHSRSPSYDARPRSTSVGRSLNASARGSESKSKTNLRTRLMNSYPNRKHKLETTPVQKIKNFIADMKMEPALPGTTASESDAEDVVCSPDLDALNGAGDVAEVHGDFFNDFPDLFLDIVDED